MDCRETALSTLRRCGPLWVHFGTTSNVSGGVPSTAALEVFRRERAVVLQRVEEDGRRRSAKQLWAIKDPRLSLTAPLWLTGLRTPACVLVHRHPADVALSLWRRLCGKSYAQQLSLREWARVWARYVASAVTACRGVPTAVIRHEELIDSPWPTLARPRW